MGKHEAGYLRIDKDFYPTPAWPVWALAGHIRLAGKFVWEPAAGAGHMAETLKAIGASVYCTDIEYRGYDLSAVADFLTVKPPADIHGIITNPPWSLARQFIERGLIHIADGKLLALLLPADFESAKTRQHLFGGCPYFAAKIVLTRRIMWFEAPAGERKSPKENSAWYVWLGEPRSRPPIILYAPKRNGAAA